MYIWCLIAVWVCLFDYFVGYWLLFGLIWVYLLFSCVVCLFVYFNIVDRLFGCLGFDIEVLCSRVGCLVVVLCVLGLLLCLVFV